MITLGLMQDPTGESLPLFEWKNADQLKCEQDWHFSQILQLFQEFGAWKAVILHKQDLIKIEILEAESVQDLDEVLIVYT